MRQGKCCECGLLAGIGSFYSFNEKTYCEPCVWKASAKAKERGEPYEYLSLTDNSICRGCGVYSGDAVDHPVIGDLALCPACADRVTNWPYPTWLKFSFVLLLVLLVVALVNGRKYFRAGRNLYIGERLVQEQQYERAIPYLQQTLALAPNSDKAALLTAKAALKAGEVGVAYKALQGHENGRFENGDDSEVQEIDQMWRRASSAVEKADQAMKLAKEGGHEEEAAKLMHEAAASYPEAKGLAYAAQVLDEGVAFVHRDYDAFLAVTRNEWSEHQDPRTAAAVASALACKFAVTGDKKYRDEAENMLHEAEIRARSSDADEMKSFKEYEPRIRYRLKSREIIDTAEYDRRFRSNVTATK